MTSSVFAARRGVRYLLEFVCGLLEGAGLPEGERADDDREEERGEQELRNTVCVCGVCVVCVSASV